MSQQYQAKPHVVTATQWIKPGDHPKVTGDTRRWANASDPAAYLTQQDYAKNYNHTGMILGGTLTDQVGAQWEVESGFWIVEDAGVLTVYENEDFLLRFTPVASLVPTPPAPTVLEPATLEHVMVETRAPLAGVDEVGDGSGTLTT